MIDMLGGWLDVNGQRMQTCTMIFDTAIIVSYMSAFTRLEPGDLICAGPPPGVGAGKKGNPNASAYSRSKAIEMIKSMGKELTEKNITVNCVTPAAAKTRIFDQVSKEVIEFMLQKIRAGAFDRRRNRKHGVVIASAENSFIKGAVFDLSAGQATYSKWPAQSGPYFSYLALARAA
ncbi:short chain dehydrogenase [Epibacterium ulvae]|uniref:Short chain dehydrogenase n=1 Tax=Epibacterium ulvae TaxID=1156985 RepID=A0A1G5QF87_9RHOB|nr:short chain dehydrogenase [Epibacterium ulvae]